MVMPRPSVIGGIVAMLAATAAFVAGDSFMKIVTEDLPPFEVLFLRGIVASIFCIGLVIVRREGSIVSGILDIRSLLRAVCEALSTLCYIVALARMPIADVVAILQTAPLILIIGAALVLREKIGLTRVFLALIGFAGAVMVAQPAASGFSAAAPFAFGAAFLVAARDLVGRGIASRIPVTVVTLTTTIMVMAVAGTMSLAFEDWVPPSGYNIAFLASAGLFVTLGHGGLLLAYRLGSTASIAPFFYSFALWGVVSGLIIWAELPNALALAGIALIVASGVVLVMADQRRHAIPISEAL
jgi:drug/metabolite transporter (DMT)-like permease